MNNLRLLLLLSFPTLSWSLLAQEGLPDVSKLAPIEFREEKVGDIQIGTVKIKNLTVGVPITVDTAFTTKWENNPPSIPFKIIAPKNERILFYPGGKKSGIPELIKIIFADEEKKKALEIARFSNLTIPLYDDPKDRHKLCARTIQTKVLPMVFKGMKDPKVLEVYGTKIDDCDAVVFHCQNFNPTEDTLFFTKLVGILHPEKPGGVLAFLTANSKLSDIKKFEDYRTKGVGMKILHSLKVMDEK